MSGQDLNRTSRYLYIAFFALLVSFSAKGEDYPKDYFSIPVKIPVVLSGTFGEPRSTHFHAGLDIKTQGREGIKIYACAEGYVSRVKISPYGYGKAVYITHPNGYTTVYAHLSRLEGEIGKAVRDYQYAVESFAIDWYLPKDSVMVKREQVIALSGNSGSSGGPHLHFEIRDSSERPINPLHFGIAVKDVVKPSVMGLALYNRDPITRFNTMSKIESVTGNAGAVKTVKDTIRVNAQRVGFAVHTWDRLNGANNKNGVYQIKTYTDDSLCFNYEIDKFSFSEGRYVYSHIDQELRAKHNKTFHKCFIDPGNNLSVYDVCNGHGSVMVHADRATKVRVEVLDWSGNTSSVTTHVRFDPSVDYFQAKSLTYNYKLAPGVAQIIDRDGLEVHFDESAFFDTLFMDFEIVEDPKKSPYSSMYQLHEHGVQLFNYFEIAVKADSAAMPDPSKALLVSVDAKGRKRAHGGEWRKGKLVGESRNLGKYYVQLDTKSPSITPLDIYENKKISNQKYISYKIGDDLAGIEDYDLYINGKWELLDYDPRVRRVRHEITDLPPGKNELLIKVRDGRNNEAIRKTTVIY